MMRVTGTLWGYLTSRAGPFRHLASLFRLVWTASSSLTAASMGLRLVRAVQPLLALWIGKLIIDAVVTESRHPSAGESLAAWVASGRLNRLTLLLGAECALALLANALGRASALVDGLLSDRYSNFASIKLMDHAATLDLEQLESSAEQDRLDRARRQVGGRTSSARPRTSSRSSRSPRVSSPTRPG